MFRFLAAAGFGLFLSGCTKPEPPPAPAPLKVVIPDASEMPTTDAGGSPSDINSLIGKWTHTRTGQAGDVVLEYIKDEDGRERFEFLEWPWPQKPIFEQQVTNGDRSELRFKLESSQPDAPPQTLRYVLTKNGEQWKGQLFESWTEAPYDVVLTKLQ